MSTQKAIWKCYSGLMHNCQKFETIWISTSWWMIKQIVVCLTRKYNLAIKKEWSTQPWNRRHYANWKKPDSKGYNIVWIPLHNLLKKWLKGQGSDQRLLGTGSEEGIFYKGTQGNASGW